MAFTTAIILDVGELIDFRKFRTIRRILNIEMRKANIEGANAIAKFAREMIRGGPRRTGTLRRNVEGGRQRRIRSSARGEWPKERTGDLRRSIKVMRGAGLSSEIGSNLDYAEILEGPEGSDPSQHRQHITRAAREKEPFFQKLAERAVRRAIRRAGG